MIFSLLLLLSLLALSNAQQKCLQCATPDLKENWMATGLPKYPPNISFTDQCDGGGPTQGGTELRVDCTTTCFEMIFPLFGVFQLVKGCHDQFLLDTKQAIIGATDERKGYSQVFTTQTVVNTEGVTVPAFSSLVYVKPGENLKNTLLTAGASKPPDETAITLAQTYSCISCSKYDGKGKCSKDYKKYGSQPSIACKKTTGKYSGHDIEERGAAIMYPYTTTEPFCYNIDSETIFATGVVDNQVRRSKRDIIQTISTTVCFCTGENCNSAQSWSLVSMSGLVLLFSLIPFY